MTEPQTAPRRPRRRPIIDWGSGVVFIVVALLAMHLVHNFNLGTAPPSATWSRSVAVGVSSYNLRPGVDVLPDGSLLCAWTGSDGLGMAKVSPYGQVTQLHPSFPGMGPAVGAMNYDLAAGTSGATLLWTEQRGPAVQLCQARLDADGNPRTRASVLGTAVAAWAVARPAGDVGGVNGVPQVVLVQEGGRLRALTVGADGALAPLASAPAIPDLSCIDGAVDESGTVHIFAATVASLASFNFLYLTANEDGFSAPLKIREERFNFRNTLRSPRIALDGGRVYFMWGNEETKPRTGRATSWWLSFSRDAPGPAEPRRVTLPVTHLSLLPSDFVCDPAPISTTGDGVTVATSSMVMWTRLRTYQEIVVVSLEGDEQGDEVPASFGRPASLTPYLAAGAGGDYAVWLDTAGFNRYHVCVASTNGAFRAGVDRREASDWLYAGLDTVVHLGWAVGMSFTAGPWFILPFMIVGGAQLLALNWAERRARLLTLIAAAIHVALKVYTVQGTFYGSPLVCGMMPAWLAHPASHYLVPLAISGVALWSVLRMWRGAARTSALSSYARFALIDVALTLLLYAPYLLI